jgi:hypothetical protein
MPEPQPTENILSQPVEPIFRNLVPKVIDESFCYGFSKYGTELKTFNGRRELQDLAEELISGLRYATQLAMRCHKYEELLIDAWRVFEAHGLTISSTPEKFMAELQAAVEYATRSEPHGS